MDKAAKESSGAEEQSQNESQNENADDVIDLDPENDLRAFKDADPASKEWKNR